jgi:sec-independent protein translocase protein TatC
LGSQQLYYLTPIGGLSFIIKLCFYFGVLVSVPVIVYHVYRYLQPLMGGQQRSVLRYFIFSFLLAAAGISFAYFISLPAALHFLTDFNIQHITAMLTVDAYLTFVTSYLLGAALLFQIPLLLIIIDKITPLTPGGLMKYQRHVILIAFILAAIISPTPDMVNQTLLAVPIIAMYQFGVLLVWWQHTRRKRAAQKDLAPSIALQPELSPIPVIAEEPPEEIPQISPEPTVVVKPKPTPTILISDFGPRRSRPNSPVKSHPIARTPKPLSRELIPKRHIRLERPRPGLTSSDGIIAR